VVELAAAKDPAAVFEKLFASHRWGESWRNGVYDFVHYHSQIHEVLGIARGSARLRFGGNKGEVLEVAAGDVAVLPAGTGHPKLSASTDFLVVGAYPPDGTYDLCRGGAADHAKALATIANVPVPKTDPVFGADGPLVKLWAR
ncbi:MAG: cupin, partial [Alphaproteobacteria bacterium]